MSKRLCRRCGISIDGTHFNCVQCKPCQIAALEKPAGTMTPSQIRAAKTMAGKFPRDEIAKRLGVSLSNLKRSCPGVSFYFFNRYANNPSLVERIGKFYEKHGKRKTQERFPDVNVRSIVERYKVFSPRQVRWTASQIKEAAQMAGIISLEKQATYFNRPRANKGSIISLWMKTFKTGGGNVNGIAWHVARHFVRQSCPVVETDFWRSRQIRRNKIHEQKRAIVLWKDFASFQKASNPDWIKDAAKTLARFQEWLHETKQVRRKVKTMLEERV
jgi:hypothetical protein